MAETKTIVPTLKSPPVVAGNPFRQKKSPEVVSKPPAILDVVWDVLHPEEQRRVAHHCSLRRVAHHCSLAPQRMTRISAPRPVTDHGRMMFVLCASKQRPDNHSPWSSLSKTKNVMRLISKVTRTQANQMHINTTHARLLLKYTHIKSHTP